MAEAFVSNLKLLNAKERDHLMRFAYLGQDNAYENASTFLSEEFSERLLEHLGETEGGMGLSGTPKCVFAGMDYHLDWLFAALWLAKTRPDWKPEGESDLLPQPMASLEALEEEEYIKPLYTDFRPITGSQEDIDLLVVYDDGNKLAVLFIEAKGSAAFNTVQLARKIIRLDRILVDSGMTSQNKRLLEFRLLLAAPKEYRPKFGCCLEYVKGRLKSKTGKPDKYKAMRKALELEEHPSGIGIGLHFIEIPGYPKRLYAVERARMTPGPGSDTHAAAPNRYPGGFTHWALKERKGKKPKEGKK